MKANVNKPKTDFPLILKSGATDLRRQEKTLCELVKHNYPNGIQHNTLYAFSNKNNNTIKILKVNPDTSTMLVKIKRKNQFSWPEYHAKGGESYTVELRDEKKKCFLETIGITNLF
jgi:hypothetical protein